MPQMSNLWWLPLIIYFSILLIVMNTIIFTFTSKFKIHYKKTNLKPNFNNWKW
uniref:ATP synthase F0 subunit 8 n=1 Tax=Paragavialidium hainanense TaxID=3024219 RepID=UPI0023AA3E33|nr:ATP synthase F0 subunit 8 [Paragavialidium hainanense]WCF77140.1 ATP synthase F0 subunit 8 [Paragavialidium hainanense]